ncbi:gamma-glutamylcyclotransferase [Pontivivens insulae]|uniref:ADP-ribose pyrophosphatase n=1 Tax=Pontivivens insulae TaxID=1639689 RepID=A0A2R8ADC2_9RHOB|nr:gamma-glutamylcyclotransferase [Pontivivens insulae]RED13984.1 nudix-type nucleoside diphosphatase (YffH/AdpP family) [Pontivivens insulae]SPF30058.1 ADP-ribose pyrophosphatase [Pontivivens insulae]
MARNLFFYGTLRDAETREIVLGPYAGAVKVSPATLPDHAARAVVGEDYPVIVKEPGARAEGVVVRDIPEGAVARLSYFEDEFDYALEHTLADTPDGPVEVEVFYVRGTHLQVGDAWDFAAWSARQQAAFAECARGLMALYGKVPDEEVDRIWPGIRFRAYARARARAERVPARYSSDLTLSDVEIAARSEPYVDYFAIEALTLSHKRFDGSVEGPVDRAVFVTGDAVCALPYDPVRDEVLLIEQLRIGPVARCDGHPWLLEPVAGRVDRVETSAETARREMLEETGLSAGRLEELPPFYSSPGVISEQLTCFIAEADLSNAGGVHGLESEAEDIRSIRVPVADLRALLASGEVRNGPLHLLILHLLLHHDRLRTMWRD